MTANGRHRADPLAGIDHTLAVIARLQGQLLIQRSQLTGEADLFEAKQPPVPVDELVGIFLPDDDPGGSVDWVRRQRDPEPVDLQARLAPYHASTEDVPRDVVCAVLDALAMCDLSLVKPALGDLRTALTVQDDYPWIGDDNDPRTRELNTDVWEVHSRLLWQLRADGAWPQQPARTRERIYRGRAAE